MTVTDVSLVMSEEERKVIQEILEERHRTLLMEISNTDHYHYKSVLKHKAELLEAVLNRLQD